MLPVAARPEGFWMTSRVEMQVTLDVMHEAEMIKEGKSSEAAGPHSIILQIQCTPNEDNVRV